MNNNLGIAYRKKGLLDEAIKHYLIAISLNPDSVEFHNNLGNAYGIKGLIDEAIKELQIALSINEDYAESPLAPNSRTLYTPIPAFVICICASEFVVNTIMKTSANLQKINFSLVVIFLSPLWNLLNDIMKFKS